ncbi:MAG: GSCFA domain-containing protein [Cytophagales bacterium]|nr:GSCFA domain-containing protein [Bernardetiaceae bacterium]MDW8210585.1 GSCFA domain-containing protein [Cytophagales bacterium]
MQFRTELNVLPSAHPITHSSRLLLVGSCFAEEIGQKLLDNKFEVLVNPFGTIFNPLSLFELLEKSFTGGQLPSLVVEREGRFFHYGLHSCHSAPTAQAMEQLAQALLRHTAEWIDRPPKNDARIIITLGTAWIYELAQTGIPVANCHKMPAHLFNKRLLKVEEIVSAFDNLFNRLPSYCRIIVTVSPVRHLKDTLPLNAVSKSVLRLAAHQICQDFPGVEYFPAYELLLDDLRDYRFYAKDLLHPSEEAVEYIFEKFATAYFSAQTMQLIQRWEKIRQALQHRPLQPYSLSHGQFLEQLLEQLRKIAPYLPVSQELAFVEEQLKRCS